jgi:hypothetical protein
MKIAIPVVQDLVARHDLSGRVRQLQTHHNALDSALLRLPNEALLSIVDLLLSDSVDGRGGTTGWLAFMSTCTRARSLVLDTPRLWARVDLAQNVDWVRLCVQRAHLFPLSISSDDTSLISLAVRRGDRGSEDSDKEAQRLDSFRTVANLAFPRARQAEVHVFRRAGFHHIVYDILHSPLPHLCSLKYDGLMWANEDMPFRRLLPSAPALTSLCLSYMRFSVVNLCLPSLVRLKLLGVVISEDPGVMFRFLKKSPLLRELNLNIIYVQSLANLWIEPISLLHLRSLTLCGSESTNISHLRALPQPSDHLDVHVSEHGPEVARIHELCDYIWGLIDVKRSVVIDINAHHMQRDLSMHLHLIHPGLRIGQVSYWWSTPLHNLHTALARAETIRIAMVEQHYPSELFERAAQDPHHCLAGVHGVILKQACDAHAHHAFRTWLRARVDVGRRVTTVDLRGCLGQRSGCWGQRSGWLWKEEREGLQRMAEELQREGMAEEVLVEGKRRAG